MTRSKLEFEEPKDLEQSICSDLTKEYGLDYEFGSSIQFRYNKRKNYEGVIIGFNPNTQKYKIICKNDDNSTPLQGKKNRIIEIEKDDIIDSPKKTVPHKKTLSPLIVSLLDVEDILSMSALGLCGSKKVCVIDFDFKKIIEKNLLTEMSDRPKPNLLLKHYTLGGKRLAQVETSDLKFCPAFRFKYGTIYLHGGTSGTAFYCNQVSYTKLIKKIFEKKPQELGYLLIYISIVLGRNLSILNCYNLTSGDVCAYLEQLKGMDEAHIAKKIEELAAEILGCLDSPRCHIDSTLSIEELQQQGWNITTNTNKEKRREFFASYNSKKKEYSRRLESKLFSKAKPEEFNYFFRGDDGRQNKDAIDILKTISSITIKSHSCTEIDFDITFSPLFEACASFANNALNQIVFKNKTKYKEYSVLDMQCFLGRLANSAREGNHVFSYSYSSDGCMENAEENMLKEAINNGLIENHSDGKYRFSQKYVRIYLDGFFTAYFLEERFICESKENQTAGKTNIVGAAIDQMFYFSKPDNLMDHLDFRLAEPSLFALSLLTHASIHFREKLIIELIERAKNYEVKNNGRFEQELAAHILCYLMATNPDLFTYQNTKSAFTASCSRQLYPAQASLLREMMRKNAFFKKYPQEQFRKALEITLEGDENYTFKQQPEFYFYQTFCQGKLDSIDSLEFFDLTSRAQYESWVTENYEKTKSCLRKAYDKEICNFNETTFSIQSSGDDAVKKLYGMQLWLYALSNICCPALECNADTFIVEEVLGKKNEEKESVLNHLLKVVFYADFFQKRQNPYYPSRINEMTMICGSFRFFNTFEFDVTVALPSQNDSALNIDYIKEYRGWMEKESRNSRYYWFQRRLLSYYISQCTYNECEENYTNTVFLKYDRFPKGYQSFVSNPRQLS